MTSRPLATPSPSRRHRRGPAPPRPDRGRRALGLDPGGGRVPSRRRRHGSRWSRSSSRPPRRRAAAGTRARPRPVPRGRQLRAGLRATQAATTARAVELARASIRRGTVGRRIAAKPAMPAGPGGQRRPGAPVACGSVSTSPRRWEGGRVPWPAHLRGSPPRRQEAGFESIWVMDHRRADPAGGPAGGTGPARAVHHARIPRRLDDARLRIGALVPASPTAASSSSEDRSRRSTCSPAAAPSAGSAPPGPPRSTPTSGCRSRRAPNATTSSRTRSSSCRSCGARGPGFTGRALQVPARPPTRVRCRDACPIVVGGSGERRTLRLVAEHADGCNLRGDAPRRCGEARRAPRGHCRPSGADPAAIEVTHLSTALAAPSADDGRGARARLRPGRTPPSRYAAAAGAATVAEHVAASRRSGAVGVQTAIVRLADLGREPDAIARFAPVIAALAAP